MILHGAVRKPEPDARDWLFTDHPLCMATPDSTLPKKKSIKDKFGPVYTQTCGDCTSNAALACDAYYYHTDAWVPSAVFTYYIQREKDHCIDEDCGGSVEGAIKAVRKYGACNSKVWSNQEPFNKKPSKEAYADGLKGHEITKFYAVKSFTQIKKAICLGYPVATAAEWAFKSIDPETHILNDPTKKEIKECELGHAFVIVSYDDERKLFEIRNSWGPDWGDKGYGFITYSTMTNVIWFDDSYAIVR